VQQATKFELHLNLKTAKCSASFVVALLSPTKWVLDGAGQPRRARGGKLRRSISALRGEADIEWKRFIPLMNPKRKSSIHFAVTHKTTARQWVAM
jgi:hypothetical protein